MKKIICLFFVLITCQACANSGSTIGNGLVAEGASVRKELVELCEKKHGKIEKKSDISFCLLSDKKEVSIKEMEDELAKTKK